MKLNKNLLNFFVIPMLFAFQSARADLVDAVRDKAGLYTLKYAKIGGIAFGGLFSFCMLIPTLSHLSEYKRRVDNDESVSSRVTELLKCGFYGSVAAIAGYATYKLCHFDVQNFHSGAVG